MTAPSGSEPIDESDTNHTALDTETRRLLYTLVSIPSPSGDEGTAADRLVRFFKDHGREAFRDEVGNVRAPADDSVLLTGHIDTVPGSVPIRITDGDDELDVNGPVLWGRGSVDATGALAAMAVAAVDTGVSFAGLVREETDSSGARHLMAEREPPEAVVNGEPSGWSDVTLGYRGFVGGRYEVSESINHSSRPEPNAIEQALEWWKNVTTELQADDPPPGVDRVSATPVSIDGGRTDDGLATKAWIEFELRLPPGLEPGAVRSQVDQFVEAGEIGWKKPIPAWQASPRTPLARAFRRVIREHGGDPGALRKTGTADANLFANEWGVPTVAYGPGESSLDHAPNERISLDEVDRATDVLRGVCGQLTTGER